MLENTSTKRRDLPESEVFFTSEFSNTRDADIHGFGLDAWRGNAQGTALCVFSTSSPPGCVKTARVAPSLTKERKPMSHHQPESLHLHYIDVLKCKQPANEFCYQPVAYSDPAFVSWMHRVTMKVLNLPNPSPDWAVMRAFVSEGIPSEAWAEGYKFAVSLSRLNRRARIE